MRRLISRKLLKRCIGASHLLRLQKVLMHDLAGYTLYKDGRQCELALESMQGSMLQDPH